MALLETERPKKKDKRGENLCGAFETHIFNHKSFSNLGFFSLSDRPFSTFEKTMIEFRLLKTWMKKNLQFRFLKISETLFSPKTS